MDWRDIPSLAALRAFEAAARLRSLSAAARELNVTHAAIAQHLRTLNDHFGEVLLEREGQAMVPTPVGRQLAASVSEGFGRIAEGVRDIKAQTRSRGLSVTTTPSFAESWLMPRLGSFWSAHPEISLSINPSRTLSNLRGDGFDLALRYGRGDWPGLECEFLTSASYQVVAAPSLIATHPEILDRVYSRAPWLVQQDYQEPLAWAREAGLVGPSTPIIMIPTLGMIVSGVKAGAGISVLHRFIADPEILTGSLRLLHSDHAQDLTLGYWIVTRPGVVSANLTTFIRWLRQVSKEVV
jgi:LysR family transcriptional regulator, glycine cleavage system transcriptional activator